MMKKQQEPLKEIVKIFQDLKKSYPKQTIGHHIAFATCDYDLENMSDNEFLFAMEKYQSSLELDFVIDYDRYLYDELDEEDIYER